MWALFYKDGCVSKPYPNKASVLRDAKKSGIVDDLTGELEQGYDVREMTPQGLANDTKQDA